MHFLEELKINCETSAIDKINNQKSNEIATRFMNTLSNLSNLHTMITTSVPSEMSTKLNLLSNIQKMKIDLTDSEVKEFKFSAPRNLKQLELVAVTCDFEYLCSVLRDLTRLEEFELLDFNSDVNLQYFPVLNQIFNLRIECNRKISGCSNISAVFSRVKTLGVQNCFHSPQLLFTEYEFSTFVQQINMLQELEILYIKELFTSYKLQYFTSMFAPTDGGALLKKVELFVCGKCDKNVIENCKTDLLLTKQSLHDKIAIK